MFIARVLFLQAVLVVFCAVSGHAQARRLPVRVQISARLSAAMSASLRAQDPDEATLRVQQLQSDDDSGGAEDDVAPRLLDLHSDSHHYALSAHQRLDVTEIECPSQSRRDAPARKWLRHHAIRD